MQISSNLPNWCLHGLSRKRRSRPGRAFALFGGLLIVSSAPADFFCSAARAQQTEGPVVVQRGAPGKPSKKLPPSTTAKLPPRSHMDVEFMQGMIMQHAQAVE